MKTLSGLNLIYNTYVPAATSVMSIHEQSKDQPRCEISLVSVGTQHTPRRLMSFSVTFYSSRRSRLPIFLGIFFKNNNNNTII